MPFATLSRKQLRIPGHDYSKPGAYFVTVCASEAAPQFGEIIAGRFMPNQYGEAVQRTWTSLPQHYKHVALDAFVVMPDHIHGIILLTQEP